MPANHQQQLSFLQEKIEQIGSAIFFNLSESVLKLPTSIISNLKMDDYGYVWFFVKKPKQSLQEFETEFPVRLDFFKKGVDYFLQVGGKGWVVSDPEVVNTFADMFGDHANNANWFNEVVLVKVKVMKAEYYETQLKGKVSWWQHAVNTVSTWFGNPNHVGHNTYFPAS